GPEIHAMNRLTHEVVARNDRAVRTQALRCHQTEPEVTHIAAVPRGHPLAGAVKVQTAYLYSETRSVDAVQHGAMALIGDRQAVFAGDVLRDGEIQRCARQRPIDDRIHVRLRDAVAECRERVRPLRLPSVAEAFVEARLETVIVRVALEQPKGDDAPLWERTMRDVG